MSIATTLNAMDDDDARAALTNCCAAQAWVDGMLARRPFVDERDLERAVGDAAINLTIDDWLEAFAAHPMIGDVESLRGRYASTRALATEEQAGAGGAAEATLAELARLNHKYYDQFGFIFIVFATGKSAGEMLAILNRRIRNTRKAELRNASYEQMKIAWRRLEKLAAGEDNS